MQKDHKAKQHDEKYKTTTDTKWTQNDTKWLQRDAKGSQKDTKYHNEMQSNYRETKHPQREAKWPLTTQPLCCARVLRCRKGGGSFPTRLRPRGLLFCNPPRTVKCFEVGGFQWLYARTHMWPRALNFVKGTQQTSAFSQYHHPPFIVSFFPSLFFTNLSSVIAFSQRTICSFSSTPPHVLPNALCYYHTILFLWHRVISIPFLSSALTKLFVPQLLLPLSFSLSPSSACSAKILPQS